MRRLLCHLISTATLFLGGHLLFADSASAEVPVVTTTNTTLRVMAANITTGNNQRYEGPGMRIFRALQPDVIAVQEFNYASPNGAGISTPAAIREMVDSAFGTNFFYYREAGSGYFIPNGIISRWPILTNGTWDDAQVPDRGFAWARIDIPGTNDLYVVSVHLHSGGGSSSRAAEATNLRALIQASFPSNAFIVVAGDFNTDTRSETALNTFRTFLSDAAIPTDQAGDPDTNLSRAKPYDYVLSSFNLASNQTTTVVGTNRFANGLVFDSRVRPLLFDPSVVFTNDSSAVNMQHMAVVKDFRISYSVTNHVTVPAPSLTLIAPHVIHWTGVNGLTYTVQTNFTLGNWAIAGTATSVSTNFWFTNSASMSDVNFFRVVYP